MTELIEVPPEIDACEMCGASFAGASFWHQTVPVERWLCEGCNEREGSAIRKGRYEASFFANDGECVDQEKTK